MGHGAALVGSSLRSVTHDDVCDSCLFKGERENLHVKTNETCQGAGIGFGLETLLVQAKGLKGDAYCPAQER